MTGVRHDRRPIPERSRPSGAGPVSAGSTARFGPYRGHTQRLRREDVLFRQGEPVEAVFRIRSGLVKLVTYLRGGEARIVRLQRAGDWLGLAGFLDRPCGHTAVALSGVTVERFAMECLARMRHDDAEALNELLSQWHRDLAAADLWIAQFSTGSVRQRVARLIRYLAGLEEADATRVHLPTVREIGEILGVRPESVSRVLADLKRNSVLVPAGHGRRHDTYRVNVALLTALRGASAPRTAETFRPAAR
jgi:CRP/FNR family transcriptional regulator